LETSAFGDKALKAEILQGLDELTQLSDRELIQKRIEKFSKMGFWNE